MGSTRPLRNRRSSPQLGSLEIAERVIEQLKAKALPADPAIYELWYAYLAGQNNTLCRAIDELLASGKLVTPADLERLHERFFMRRSQLRQTDTAMQGINQEVDQVVAMIEAALGGQSRRADEAQEVSKKFDNKVDHDNVRLIVETLIQLNRETEQEISFLGKNLSHSKQYIEDLQRDLELVTAESISDAVTGLPNRRHFERMLRLAMEQSQGVDAPLSLAMCDIDHFKRFNDIHGHLTGDSVLHLVALEMTRQLPANVIVSRYGGEEFSIIFPETDVRNAARACEQIRLSIADRQLKKRSTGEELGQVTISIGIAQCDPQDTAEALVERADTCLYKAKYSGRNRVVHQAPTHAPAKAS